MSLNELKIAEGIENFYDLNGNLIVKKCAAGETHFTYDPLCRMTEVNSKV